MPAGPGAPSTAPVIDAADGRSPPGSTAATAHCCASGPCTPSMAAAVPSASAPGAAFPAACCACRQASPSPGAAAAATAICVTACAPPPAASARHPVKCCSCLSSTASKWPSTSCTLGTHRAVPPHWNAGGVGGNNNSEQPVCLATRGHRHLPGLAMCACNAADAAVPTNSLPSPLYPGNPLPLSAPACRLTCPSSATCCC